MYKNNMSEKNAIVISCYKCDCVIDYLEHRNKELFKKLNIKIFGDSNCSNTINRVSDVNYFSQAKLDSILLKNYNAVLFKESDNKILYKILETENSDKFNSIVKDFFQ